MGQDSNPAFFLSDWQSVLQDYQKMREMIFGEPPAIDHLFAVLGEIEQAVNGNAGTGRHGAIA